MARDEERIGRVQRVLSESQWDAIVCTLPSNVLLLAGYWHRVGFAAITMMRFPELSAIRGNPRARNGLQY
jgi:hypothetical protein